MSQREALASLPAPVFSGSQKATSDKDKRDGFA
jgi:hypothetical protein